YDMSNLDYVLVDCPPSLGLLTLNALVAAEEVLLPIQCEYYALEGAQQLLNTAELGRANFNPGLHVSTVPLPMYDGRTRPPSASPTVMPLADRTPPRRRPDPPIPLMCR